MSSASTTWTKRTTLRTRTKDSVLSNAFNSDDSLLAVGHFCGTLNIFDVRTTAKIHELNLTFLANTKSSNASNNKAFVVNKAKHDEHRDDNERQKQDPRTGSSSSSSAPASPTQQEVYDRHDQNREKLPITGLAFRPAVATGGASSSNSSSKSSSLSSTTTVLLACCSNGQWVLLDALSAEIIKQDKDDNDNEIYCCGWNSSGRLFATAGRDSFVRIYDADSGTCVKRFTIQSPGSIGHTAPPLRIYSVAWHLLDPNFVYAGGWSQTVTAFDVRDTRDGYIEPSRRRDVFGPMIMGDALCLVPRIRAGPSAPPKKATATTSSSEEGNDGSEKHEQDEKSSSSSSSSVAVETTGFDIFTASHRLEDRLELFDGATMNKIGEIPWPNPTQQFLPLCAAASPDGNFLAFGGGGQMDDGAFVISTPSSLLRQEAAKKVAAARLQLHQLHQQQQQQSSSGEQHESQVKKLWIDFSSTSNAPVLELKQQQQQPQLSPATTSTSTSHPIVAIKFSNRSNLIAFSDSDGLTHLFEAVTTHRK